MAKVGELDWTDLMKGKVGQPEDPLSKPVQVGPRLKKGEVPRRPSDKEIRDAILAGAPMQPTDEQLFGSLVKTQEEIDAAHKEWENTFNRHFDGLKKPVEKQELNKSWGCRGPIHKEKLTEEEERIRKIAVNDSDDEV
jgi:hypothetical protein